jgi:sugar fermentation stimulation protein A
VQIEQPIVEGRFVRRYKRFFADIELEGGALVTAHCPNTGSLLGCLEPGARAILRDMGTEGRKLRYVFQAIQIGKTLVNVDTSLPNRAVFEAVSKGELAPLRGYASVQREVKYGVNSRIDLLLTKANGARCYVEVKNTTLARGKTAHFPDAVTERGKKHLEELTRMVEQGHRAVQLFFVSRNDVTRFAPADDIDPEYARALRKAAERGVEVLAYRTQVATDRLTIAGPVPVKL